MRKRISTYSFLIVVGFIIMFFTFVNPRFLTWTNFCTIFKQNAILSIISLGITIVMITGEIDFSYGGIVGLVGAIFAGMIEKNYTPISVVFLLLAVAVGFGVMNGFLVSYLRLPSFMVTVGTMFIAMGLERAYSSGLTCWIKNEHLLVIARGEFLGFPNLGWFSLITLLILVWLIYFTRPGSHFRSIGGNEKAAREVGISVTFYKLLAFMLAGFLYGIAGILEPLRVSGAIAYAGQTYLLPALTSVFLGTTMFYLGQYNIPGTFVGAFIMTMLMNGLTLAGLPFYLTPLFQGILLVIAVAIASDRKIKQVKF
ncbi:MAG: ABC transporter permease [Thermotogaceae bacterium]|nr:ABC transporter permease [Thermotogaceae bacterium]